MMTEQAWLLLCKDWEGSALPQRQFCAERQVSYAQFCAWRSKLMSRGLLKRQQPESLKPAPAFIPLSLNNLSAKSASQVIEVQLPHGILLRIPVHAEH